MIKMIKAKLKKQFPILSSSRNFFDNVMYKWGFFSISPTQNCQNLIGQWEALVKQSEEPRNIIGSNANDNCFILFLTGYGFSSAMLAVESILMMSLNQRNCKVASLYCGGVLPACEFNSSGNSCYQACASCKCDLTSVYKLLPIELYQYSNFLKGNDFQIASQIASKVSFESFREFSYSDVAVGEEVFASVLRATLRGTVEDTPEIREHVKRYLISGILMVRVLQRAFKALKPDRIVGVHGVYITHGIMVKVANKLQIPVIVYGIPYRKGTLWFSHGDSYHRTLLNEPQSYWNQPKLSPQQEEQVLLYLQSRQSGARDYVSYHPNPIEDVDFILDSLKIDNSRKIISIYTNVIWDAQIYYNFNVFKDIFEWLFLTIEELAQNSNVWVVIRIHPAEVKGGFPTSQPFLSEIKKRYPVLPDNIRVISPESDLSSYTLAQISNAAIVYGTKMGLEIAARGIPVIVCGETFNRGKGFTIDVESKHQYVAILKNICNLSPLDKTSRDLALAYAYYLFFQKMIDFPLLALENAHTSTGIKLMFSQLSHLGLGKVSNLDTICEGIIKLSPFYLKRGS